MKGALTCRLRLYQQRFRRIRYLEGKLCTINLIRTIFVYCWRITVRYARNLPRGVRYKVIPPQPLLAVSLVHTSHRNG